MNFKCVCGRVLSAEVAPGTVVQCPACGRMIRAPAAAPQTAQPPPGPTEQSIGAPVIPPAAGYGRAAAPTKTSGLAITAMVLGLLSILFLALTGIPAAIMGGVAIAKVRKSRGMVGGMGMAIAGLVLGIVFTLLTPVSIAIMMPAIRGARGAARTLSCASNLRQIGIAFTNYAVQNQGIMPADDSNIWNALSPYFGSGGGRTVWHCPSDTASGTGGCSYAFNLSLAAAQNRDISPFSTTDREGLYGEAKYFSSSPADTIVAVEMWVRPGQSGINMSLTPDDPDWSPIKTGFVAITSYTATGGATFDAQGRLLDPGPYRFLDCYRGSGTPVSQMYHRGRVNVLFIDGHVEAFDIRQLVSTPPSRNPIWTGRLD